jgi:hypothetical protein
MKPILVPRSRKPRQDVFVAPESEQRIRTRQMKPIIVATGLNPIDPEPSRTAFEKEFGENGIGVPHDVN